jgi:hypothetical protein
MFSGIFRLTDNETVSPWCGLTTTYFINVNSSGTIFAGTSGVYIVQMITKQLINILNLYNQVYSILITPNGYMYAGTHNSGLLRSTDYGYMGQYGPIRRYSYIGSKSELRIFLHL